MAHRLTALECQELHRLGYNPQDLYEGNAVGGTAGHVNVKNNVGAANAYFEDFGVIAAHGKYVG